jgi:hypothetical protein
MNKNTKRIEQYLKGIDVPECAGDLHRQRLRRQILGEIEGRQTMSAQRKAWKIGAVIAALVCTGAVATTVGVTIHRYYFEGQRADGNYSFTTGQKVIYQDVNEARRSFTVVTTVGGTTMPSEGRTVEQAQRDLEEIDRLRQQNLRKLLSVSELEVNGRFRRQSAVYEYTLSDGRTITRKDDGPDTKHVQDPPAQFARDNEEIARLRQQGQGELIHVNDTLIRGGLQRTCMFRYVLADGRERTIGESDPDLPRPPNPASGQEIAEIWRLQRLQKGTFLGYEDRMVHGTLFTFENYRFTLADGTVVTQALGDPKGHKTDLTPRDMDQIGSLAGEDAGTEEKMIQGRPFSFQKLRYVLHDGTVVVRSVGKPKE